MCCLILELHCVCRFGVSFLDSWTQCCSLRHMRDNGASCFTLQFLSRSLQCRQRTLPGRQVGSHYHRETRHIYLHLSIYLYLLYLSFPPSIHKYPSVILSFEHILPFYPHIAQLRVFLSVFFSLPIAGVIFFLPCGAKEWLFSVMSSS